MIGAESNRLAEPLAASVSNAATQALDSASIAALQAPDRQWRGQGAGPLAFSLGYKGAILSRERMAPLIRSLARRRDNSAVYSIEICSSSEEPTASELPN